MEGKAEGITEAILVKVPAFDVSLAHEISLQFGYHNADDPDEDEKIDLQSTNGQEARTVHLTPVIILVTS